MHKWEVRRLCGASTNVTKLVLTKGDPPAVAESVLYKYPDHRTRTVVCCSVQSGCPVGCRFCGTGRHFVRNLTSGEIVEQVKAALCLMDCDPNDCKRLQIMTMSMGEPMLNLAHVTRALEDMNRRWPKAELLVSTVAPRNGAVEVFTNGIAKRIDKIGLQFSIHESTDKARKILIPYPVLTLNEIAAETRRFKSVTGRRAYLNYCVHERNDSQNDVDRLARVFDHGAVNVTASVVCERDEHRARNGERRSGEGAERAERFRDKLRSAGFRSDMFNPDGQDDIGGGCGQLWFVQEWLKKAKSET